MLIILVGFMGSGKTSTGKRLANRLGYTFIDLDQLFEEKYRINVHRFFKKYDEFLYRDLERKLLTEHLHHQNTILSTGGGTPCYSDNMEMINRHGISVYIHMSPAALHQRLTHAKKPRPLILELKEEELLKQISKLLQDREQYYSKAHIRVEGLSLDLEALVGEIEHYADKGF